MKLIYASVLTLLTLSVFAQQKTDFEFRIADYIGNSTITTDNIKLIILGDNYGNGPDHYFQDGTVVLRNLPYGKKLYYRIEADNYISFFTSEELNITKQSPKYLLIPLIKKDDQSLIIKGKLKDSTTQLQIIGARIEITISQYDSTVILTSDTLGNFLFRIPDGKKFTGHDIFFSVYSPQYRSQPLKYVIKNSAINYFDLTLPKIADPPKVYNIRFSAPLPLLDKMTVLPYYRPTGFERPYEVNALAVRNGIYQIVVADDATLDVIKLKVVCSGYNDDIVSISKKKLDKSISNGNAMYTYDLNTEISSPLPAIGMIFSPNFTFLAGSNQVNSISINFNVGLFRYFKIASRYFSAEVNASILPMKYKLLGNYITLPGQNGTTESNFNIRTLPQLNLCYYLKNPLDLSLNYFFGIELGNYVQSLTKTGNENIDEKYNPNHFLGYGLKAGINYRFSRKMAINFDVNASEMRLQSTTYQFNYFGRANQENVTSNYFLLKLRTNVIYQF